MLEVAMGKNKSGSWGETWLVVKQREREMDKIHPAGGGEMIRELARESGSWRRLGAPLPLTCQMVVKWGRTIFLFFLLHTINIVLSIELRVMNVSSNWKLCPPIQYPCPTPAHVPFTKDQILQNLHLNVSSI